MKNLNIPLEWNLNKGFGDELTRLVNEINTAAQMGDVKLWFNNLRILFRNVAGHPKIDKINIKKINEKMLLAKKKMSETPSNEKEYRIYKHNINLLKEELDKINIDLITEMHAAGLIFPEQQDKGALTPGMKKFVQKYMTNIE